MVKVMKKLSELAFYMLMYTDIKFEELVTA